MNNYNNNDNDNDNVIDCKFKGLDNIDNELNLINRKFESLNNIGDKLNVIDQKFESLNNINNKLNVIDNKCHKLLDEDVSIKDCLSFILAGAAGGTLHGGLQLIGYHDNPNIRLNGNDPIVHIDTAIILEWFLLIIIIAFTGSVVGSIASFSIIGSFTKKNLIRLCVLSAGFGLFLPMSLNYSKAFLANKDLIKSASQSSVTQERITSPSQRKEETIEETIRKTILQEQNREENELTEEVKSKVIEEKINENNLARKFLSVGAQTDTIVLVHLDKSLTKQPSDPNIVKKVGSFFNGLENEFNWSIPENYYTIDGIGCKSIVRYYYPSDKENAQKLLLQAKSKFQNLSTIANFEDEPIDYSDWLEENPTFKIIRGQIDVLIIADKLCR